MDREARTTALGPMFRQVYNEVDLLFERGFEIAVQVVPVQVDLRNREEDHVSDSPRFPAAEWFLPRPRGEAEELLPLPKTRLASLRRSEEPHTRGERAGPAWSFSRRVAHKLYVGPSGTPQGRHGHGHLPRLRPRFSGGPDPGGRGTTPEGSSGMDGQCGPARREHTRPCEVQTAVRSSHPRERPDRVCRDPTVPDARRAGFPRRRRPNLTPDRPAPSHADIHGGRPTPGRHESDPAPPINPGPTRARARRLCAEGRCSFPP